ncbi:MAG: RNA polymerase sigma factor [Hyphomicrobiales bacterium]
MRDSEVMANEPPAPGREDAEELARRAAARDPAAWEVLFEQHYSRVYAFLRLRVPNPAEAEDLASQVFEIAYTRAASFDYRGVRIGAWLIGIARNLLRDRAKRLARRGFEEELDDTHAPPEADLAEAADLRRDLAAAMHTLTEDQQTVLSLRFLLDRSVAETAVVMQRSEDAVKNLQRRALAAMQRALDDAGYREDRP